MGSKNNFKTSLPFRSIAKELLVTAGSLYLRPTNCSSVEKRKVLRQVIHPKYHQQYPYNDIAVLLLWPPFDFKKNPNIKAISLATEDFEVGRQCRSLAWGSQENVNLSNYNYRVIPKIDISARFLALLIL